jgi:hypothetical protein
MKRRYAIDNEGKFCCLIGGLKKRKMSKSEVSLIGQKTCSNLNAFVINLECVLVKK